jgi:hypothetical protein
MSHQWWLFPSLKKSSASVLMASHSDAAFVVEMRVITCFHFRVITSRTTFIIVNYFVVKNVRKSILFSNVEITGNKTHVPLQS